nr:PKD domain-containing protein [uncultured Desulfobulbus sp.]
MKHWIIRKHSFLGRSQRVFLCLLFFILLLDCAVVQSGQIKENSKKTITAALVLLLGEDVDLPVIKISCPANNSTIKTRNPSISFSYAAGTFDIDFLSLIVKINDVDITSLFNVSATQATAIITNPLPAGSNTLSVSLKDEDGNVVSKTSIFTVDVFKVNIIASPDEGSTPLEVLFQPQIVGWRSPYSYQWDIDGDGSVDDTRMSFTHIYSDSGSHHVSLQVEDSRGETATADTTIKVVTPPTVIAAAEPISGTAPLEVSFSATVDEADGSIVLYEWDYDGDGTYDFASQSTASTSHTYSASGSYTSILRVTDNTGATAIDSIEISIGIVPEASAEASPQAGTAPLEVEFSGSATDGDGSVVLYEWDFDGDGVYDYSSSSTGSVSHNYSSSGIFNATLRITDNDGLKDTDSVLISVSGAPTSLPGAYPRTGDRPLTVTFFSDGKDLDGSPEYYDWDFDGDGTRDSRLIASMNTTYTYEQAGTYNAELTVIDDDGLSTSATITIVVTEPSTVSGTPYVNAVAFPSNGAVPLEVLLSATASDADGSVAKYEWDFQNDGIYDFTELVNPVSSIGEIIDVGSYSSPYIVDIDNDGDPDIFVGANSGTINFLRNDGSADQPVWTNTGTINDSEGNTVDAGSYSSPAVIDLDNDGDLDLVIGESGGRIYFYQNDGDESVPVWTAVDYLKDSSGTTIDVGYYSCPSLADIDNDGDLDLFVGHSGGTLMFYRNDGTSSSPVWTEVGLIEDVEASQINVGSYSYPNFFDKDKDGDLDLIVGMSDGRTVMIENTGSSSVATWASFSYLQNEDGIDLDIGSWSRPATIDINSETTLIIGESNGRLILYKNTDETNLVFTLEQLYLGYVGAASYGVLALADIDNDSDKDLFIGDSDGTIYFYRNSGTQGAPVWTGEGLLRDDTGTIIDVGSHATLTFADTDGDNDLDLYVGEDSGHVYLYRNDGSPISSGFISIGAITDSEGTVIDVGYCSYPAFADIDNDGDYDLFVGDSYGRVYLYRNTNDGSSSIWSAENYLHDSSGNAIDVGSYSTPCFVDSDNDGDMDLFIGNSYGAIIPYKNTGNVSSAIWSEEDPLQDSSATQIDVGSYSTIAIDDIDLDGDLDYLISNSSGIIYVYKNVGNVLHSYTSIGSYTATLQVTDNDGNTATDAVLISVKGPGIPTATAHATPLSGNVPLKVNFTGSGYDPNGSIVLYEWDFDGDGAFDYSSTVSGDTTHTYETSGTFDATFKVTDNEGNFSSEVIPISSNFVISTTREEIFNPVDGATAHISFTIAGEANVTSQIIDSDGNVVKTLVDNEQRTTGTYNDNWDGTGTDGDIVKDGVYYFYIECEQDGVITVYDLREDATYQEITPSRSWPSSFSPYEDDVVEVSYTIDTPSVVSLYFWKRDYDREESSIAPVRTLFIRDPRAAGTYTEVWDGVDDNGVVVGSWDGGYPITLWVYELPESAIIVTGNTPVINNVDAEPNYFTPVYNPYAQDSDNYTSVSFELSKASTVTSCVRNENGVIVKTITRNNLPAGQNTILWDGKDFDGNLVKGGSYSISLKAIDSSSNQSLTRYATVYIHY